jgi:hypothetical protein
VKDEVVKEDSKFVLVINPEGRVSVDITGPHINKTTFNRLSLALKKGYRNHIKNYRRHIRTGMSAEEIENLVAEPANLKIENGRPVTSAETKVVETEQVVETIDTAAATGGTVEPIVEVKPIMTPLKDIPRRASMEDKIQASRAKALKKAEAEKLVETK